MRLILIVSFILALPFALWSQAIKADLIIVPIDCGNDPMHFTNHLNPDTIPQVTSVCRQQLFQLYLLIDNYALNNEKKTKISYYLTVSNPDGIQYRQKQGQVDLSDKIKTTKSTLLLKEIIEVPFDNNKRSGTYTYNLRVEDHSSSKTANASQSLSLIPITTNEESNKIEHYETWMQNYYQYPSPIAAITAYLKKAPINFSPKNVAEESVLHTQAIFYLNIIRNNPWLLPHLEHIYPSADSTQRKRIIFLLTLADYNQTSFLQQLKEPYNYFYDWASAFRIIPDQSTITMPVEIDAQWATFMASGEFEPIRRIVQTLEYSSYAKYTENSSVGVHLPEEQMRLYVGKLYKLAKWSLLSNCKQSDLVKQYCEYIYRQNNLSSDAQKALAGMLHEVDPKKRYEPSLRK